MSEDSQFPEGHARLVALEWMVRRLAIAQCLKTAAPVLEAESIRSDGQAHREALIAIAEERGDRALYDMTNEIIFALGELAQDLPAEVTEIVAREGSANITVDRSNDVIRSSEMTPGHHISAWRKHRRLTQAQLAQRVGVTQSAIAQLERGLISYSQPTLEAIAVALDCTPGALIDRSPKQSSNLAEVLGSLPGEARDALSTIAGMLARPLS